MIPQLTTDAAAAALRDDPAAVYLDVRTEPEWQAGHPAGSYNVPVLFYDAARRPVPNPDFERAVRALVPDTETKIVVGCQSGMRSQHAAEILARLGYRDVSNLAAGYGGNRTEAGWKDAGLPVEHGDAPGRSWRELREKA